MKTCYVFCVFYLCVHTHVYVTIQLYVQLSKIAELEGGEFLQYLIPFNSILPMSLSSEPWILNLQNHLAEAVNSGFICDIYI